jgi:putative transposase
MQFESGNIYHIYNQGNNRQKIFFKRENYFFFLQKLELHVLPYADILAWCLMPNHFHFMIYLKELELDAKSEDSSGATLSSGPGSTLSSLGTIKINEASMQSRTRTSHRMRSFNTSIGIMLASYTRAINMQEKNSGSLFRKETKAINITKVDKITPSWITSMGITQINLGFPEKQYPTICFNYILKNPVKDRLVQKAEDWEFSSYRDLIGMRNGKLINVNKIKELGLIII